MNSELKYVTLQVSSKQEQAIKRLYEENGWNYQSSTDNMKSKKKNIKGPSKSLRMIVTPPSQEPEIPNNLNSSTIPECEHCFQRPCVTTRRFPWLGDGQAPHRNNTGIRKLKYKKFWSCLTNMRMFRDPRYIERKSAGGDRNVEYYITHRRDILPVCVVKQVRDLYSNPPGVPYMDHRWE